MLGENFLGDSPFSQAEKQKLGISPFPVDA
jgi:hypothetical protein